MFQLQMDEAILDYKIKRYEAKALVRRAHYEAWDKMILIATVEDEVHGR